MCQQLTVKQLPFHANRYWFFPMLMSMRLTHLLPDRSISLDFSLSAEEFMHDVIYLPKEIPDNTKFTL